MPAHRNHTVLEIARGVRAFFTLAVGVTRGEVPDPDVLQGTLRAERLARAERGLRTQRSVPVNAGKAGAPEAGVTSGSINPEKMVWILGSPRTGSTWLSEILGEPRGHALWKEPFFGVVLNFRNNLAHRGYINSKQFLLGEPYRDVWIASMRKLFLDVGQAKFPNISPRHHLIIKEPNGSMSAPLILEAFPESKLIFLVRDSRDVVASLLDAAKEESWYGYNRYEASVAEAVRRGGGYDPVRRPASRPPRLRILYLRFAGYRSGQRAAGASRRTACLRTYPSGAQRPGQVPSQSHSRRMERGPHAGAGAGGGGDHRPATEGVLPG